MRRSNRDLRRVFVASTQRWIIAGLAIASATAPSIALSVVDPHPHLWVPIAIAALAAVAAAQPDTHVALLVIAALVAQWLALDDDPTSIWVAVTAVCILVFHTLIAFMAATPPTTTAGTLVTRRWTGRTAVVATAFIALYVFAITAAGWHVTGQVAASAALATVATATAVFTARAVPLDRRPGGRGRHEGRRRGQTSSST